jgi:hypothetical protein
MGEHFEMNQTETSETFVFTPGTAVSPRVTLTGYPGSCHQVVVNDST